MTTSQTHEVPAIARPLCVDLDGTLVRTDTLWESLLLLMRRKPWLILHLPVWALQGRTIFKSKIAAVVIPDPAALPYHATFLAHLRSAHASGRVLVLATAAHERIAAAVAAHLGIFSAVHASDADINLKGEQKAALLTEIYGAGAFDYAGNAASDLPVWRASYRAVIVEAPRPIATLARNASVEYEEFFTPPRPGTILRKSLRLHQWIKNILIFLPLILAHRAGDWWLLARAATACAAFCAAASGVYLLNDLFDLAADRRHPDKRHRPLAAGAMPLPLGVAMVPLLFLFAFAIALHLPGPFFFIVLGYVALSLCYAWCIKQWVLLDVIVLAGLYCVRIFAGAAAVDVPVSAWLIAFSGSFFLSLALVKRASELVLHQSLAHDIAGRGYRAADLPLVNTLGIVSGYIAVLIFTLYINSPEIRGLYAYPQLLWLVCPTLLYWISRVWMITQRGDMHSDPIVFAVKDSASRVVALIILIIWLCARGEVLRFFL